MIGARKETLGKTRSEIKALSLPTNESMERADLTMEDWIQETCLISAVTSGPTEPKTFQEAWHDPIENERERWRVSIRKEIRMTEFRQPLQVQSHLEMPRILVQLGHTQRT